jgi:hypothetical protein
MNEIFKRRRTEIISKMLDNPTEIGIYPTTDCFEELDSLFEELQPKWNETKPTEGSYLCFMDNCYVKMCYFNGVEWLDMWDTTLKGTVKYWMNLPKQPK